MSLNLLAEGTLGSAAASISLTSIPAGHRNLVIVVEGRISSALTEETARLRFNNDSGTNYNSQYLYGSSTAAGALEGLALTGIEVTFTAASGPANAAGSARLWVPNYAATTFLKGVHCTFGRRNGSGAGTQPIILTYTWWNSTAAINRVDLVAGSGNLVAGSSMQVYGER